MQLTEFVADFFSSFRAQKVLQETLLNALCTLALFHLPFDNSEDSYLCFQLALCYSVSCFFFIDHHFLLCMHFKALYHSFS